MEQNSPTLKLLELIDLKVSRGNLYCQSLDLFSGEILGVLGPNGSGKTTLLKSLSGLIAITELSVARYHFRGQSFLELSTQERARRVVYVGAEFKTNFPLTAYEFVSLGLELNHGEHEIFEVMELSDTLRFKDGLVTALSGGELQRLNLARALLQKTKVVLLDEALSKMDLQWQVKSMKVLKSLTAKGISFILVSHDPQLISVWADRVIFLKEGQIVKEGPCSTVLTQRHIKELYFN